MYIMWHINCVCSFALTNDIPIVIYPGANQITLL